ncbi:transcription factor MYB41 [Brachypodium distachyon]|uniref:Uncharacterized protein n=1 Tax=Brachypodium distachyon TaxID=15368 RepID=A0A0Q3FVD6_BRADI|nr:transcription factor MYB41 [Brachypodium distachyon]KQK02077.1 hypothetical protein BRADI_3g60220v3 [Brachypodium distachyon]|eukprot:XP_003573138.1 transcription factor MYB41 [Brachypodium distachyon]
MGRAPCCDKATVKKGPWSPEEDAKLKAYIDDNGTGGNWIALPQKIGLKRCGKSCRLRWLNYLRPNIKHGDFTEEEEHIICSLYISIGSRWSIIAAQLPGRTDNDIKNYWNTKLKKKLLGKRAPSRRARTSLQLHDPQPPLHGMAAAGAGSAALSSSALERIQLHMRLQQAGLYSTAMPQWAPAPKLEATDAIAMTTTVSTQQQQQQQQHIPDQSLLLNYSSSSAAELAAAEAACNGAAAEMSSMAGNANAIAGFGSYGHVDELYDFLYSNHSAAAAVGAFEGGMTIPSLLPELHGGAAVVGADEKFSAWTAAAASCGEFGTTTGGGQLQLHGSCDSINNLQDFVLGYDQ